MTKQKQNYLDFIPEINSDFPFCERMNGLVSVTIHYKGIYHKIAQTFFKTPAESKIDLDKYGSFIWKQIDGNRTIFDIGRLVEKEFGKEAAPLYPRLVKFFSILKDHQFIMWRRLHL